MKVGQKLALSNIGITVISMIILSIIISYIVSDYIEENIKETLIKENESMSMLLTNINEKFLEYKNGEISIESSYYEKSFNSPVLYAFLNMDHKAEIIDSSFGFLKDTLSKEEIKKIYSHDESHVFETKIWDQPYLVYTQSVDIRTNNKDAKILVVTFISTKDVKNIVNKIVYALIIIIAIFCIFMVVVNRFSERMITRPVKVLAKAAEEFSKKNFDRKADLHTGDEFETLAIAINNMADSLKKQDIEQKKFYESISHELKTPLTVISGYAQAIKTSIIEDHDKALDIITNECIYLKRQLENIIYLSKLDTVKESYNFQLYGINQIITNALSKIDSLIIINDIDINFEPCADFDVYADIEKLTRAFLNIFTNCVKYTKDSIYITIEDCEKIISVKISDNGSGFSQSLLKNPFSGINIGEKEGTGIGLSIVKKIIDEHEGKIKLNNCQEGGAVFLIELPKGKK